MKRRFFSIFAALALCLTLLPAAALAEPVDVEAPGTQETQEPQEPQEAPGGADPGDAGPAGGDTAAEDETETDEGSQAAQALIDALPDEVTAENAETIGEQLAAIDRALAELTGEQLAKLDRTRYEAICEALTEMTAVQEEGHTHYLCGGDVCTGVGHTCADKTTFTEWTSDSSLPETGVYYLTQDVTLESGLAVTGELTLDLNGHSIQARAERGTVIYIERTGSFTLTDCNGSGGEHYFVKDTSRDDAWKLSTPGEPDSFAVDGGVITHSSMITGKGVSVTNGGRFTMYNGTICGNYLTDYRGAGVDVHEGAFTMYGGAIRGNATTNGGGVFVNGDAAFTMHGGAISENRASESGGGVHVGSGSDYTTDNAVFTMTGGTITGNAVTGTAANGGGVYVGGKYSENSDAVFTMSGGEINDNRASGSGGGVYVGSKISDAVFTMSGGEITGNTAAGSAAANGGGVCMGGRGTLRLSGNVTVQNNKINSTDSNVYLPNDTAIQITGSLTGAVGVTLESMPASGYTAFAKAASGAALTDADMSIFSIDNDDGTCKLTRGGGELLITYGEQHIHPACGDACTHQKADGSYEHPNVTWTGTATLPNAAGYWYLTQNVEGADTWTPADGTFLDLNGCSAAITAEDKAVIAVSSGAFTLCDCRGTAGNGRIAHSTKPSSGDEYGKGCGVSLLNASDAQFTMYGGEISGSWIGVSAKDSGGFKLYGGSITGNTKHGVWQMRCPFDMYGGSITRNGSRDNVTGGSGVYVTDRGTKFTMRGGTISENTSGKRGGGVCVNLGTFEMSGGEITQNTSAGDGWGGVYVVDAFKVSGDAKVTGNTGRNVYLGNDVYSQQIRITVSGELSDSARICVSTRNTPTDEAPLTIAAAQGNWIKAGNFVSDDSFYRVVTAEDGKTATLEVHEHQWEVLKDSENVLKEHCTVANCTTAAGGTLTLTASDKDYDAAPGEAVITAPDWHSSTENYVITYEQKNDDGSFTPISGAPTAWGSYRAGVTVDGATAAQEFQIRPHTLYSGDFTFSAPSDLTYNGQPKTAAVTAKDAIAGAIGAVTVKYYDADGNAAAEPINAGTYTVKIDVAQGEGYRAETGMFDQSWTFTIRKAASTGQPSYTRITAKGKTLADAQLTAAGSTLRPAAGTLEWIDGEGNVLSNDTGVEAGKTYGWRFTPADANYDALTGEVELYHPPRSGGGSSSPTYPVSVAAPGTSGGTTAGTAAGGSVSVSTKNAAAGSTVTVSVQPEDGFRLEKLVIVDKNGNEIPVTLKDGKYTFTMPTGAVEIQPVFEKIPAAPAFPDVPAGSYYAEPVKWAAENGVTGGTKDGGFAPSDACTRAQIVTFLWRAAGCPEPKNAQTGMTDVAEDSYYAKAVAWAAENGVTSGTKSGGFDPNAPCTRAQAVTFLARALNAGGGSAASFHDVPADSYYAAAVAWAVEHGVTNGTKDGGFSPNAACTRAQIVTFLFRAYQGK